MDFLKRSLAPITDEGWQEIEDQAREVLSGKLSGRKVVDVVDPKGWDYSSIPEGRLDIKENSPGAVRYGIRKVLPLVETRKSFKLDVWELDNLSRGAEDVDLSPLEDAAAEAAGFEENVIYHGLSDAGIEGLFSSAGSSVDLSEGKAGMIEAVSEAITVLQDEAIEGPYNLLVDKDFWLTIASSSSGYPLKRQLEDLIEGEIVYSPQVKDPALVSSRGGDIQLVLGQDFSLGYEDHGDGKVKLFLTESFGFRVLEPAAIVNLAR